MSKEEVLETNVRLEELELGVFSPRKVFDAKYIDELAFSIKKEGQLKPVIVRMDKETGKLQLIDGEHRVKALKKLGEYMVRAEVRPYSYEEALFYAMRINEMHGKRLNDLEEGIHMLRLNQELGWSEERIAKGYVKSQEWVSDRVRIARNASDDLRNYHARGKITTTHARKLVQLPKETQPDVVKRVVLDDLTSKETEELVNAIKKEPENKDYILSLPIKGMAKTVEELKRLVSTAPEEAVLETLVCPHCGKGIWVDWVARRIYAKRDSD